MLKTLLYTFFESFSRQETIMSCFKKLKIYTKDIRTRTFCGYIFCKRFVVKYQGSNRIQALGTSSLPSLVCVCNLAPSLFRNHLRCCFQMRKANGGFSFLKFDPTKKKMALNRFHPNIKT